MQYSLTDLLTEAEKPEPLGSSVRRAGVPILMITAGQVPDEGNAAWHIAEAASNVSIWTVPDAGHTQGLSAAPDDWEHRVVGFLDSSLASD